MWLVRSRFYTLNTRNCCEWLSGYQIKMKASSSHQKCWMAASTTCGVNTSQSFCELRQHICMEFLHAAEDAQIFWKWGLVTSWAHDHLIQVGWSCKHGNLCVCNHPKTQWCQAWSEQVVQCLKLDGNCCSGSVTLKLVAAPTTSWVVLLSDTRHQLKLQQPSVSTFLCWCASHHCCCS